MSEQLSLGLTEQDTQHIVWILIVDFINDIPHLLLAPKVGSSGNELKTHTFPGGKINANETPAEAALRELEEETGIVITEDTLINAYRQSAVLYLNHTIFICHGFFALYDEFHYQKPQNLEPEKQGDWRWLTLAEAQSLSLKGHLPLVVFNDFWQQILEEVIELSKIERQAQIDGISPAWILTK